MELGKTKLLHTQGVAFATPFFKGGENVENMMVVFMNIGVFFMPILCAVFCLNLVSILKKIKNEEKTTVNTAWLIISFTLIMWSIAMLGVASA